MRQRSDRVVYFPNADGEPAVDARDALVRRHIRVEPGVVTGLCIDAGHVTGVQVDERVVPVGVVFTGSLLRPHDGLSRSLGAATTESALGSWVDIDEDGRTSISGVSAAGDVVDARANVPVSLGAGALVAGALNSDLVADDIARALDGEWRHGRNFAASNKARGSSSAAALRTAEPSRI